MALEESQENVVPLGVAPEPKPADPPPSQSRLHVLAIAGMALCAVIGILSMLAFITVTWPGNSGRYVIGVFIGSGVGFMTSASLAVFSAARETHVKVERPRK